MTSISKGKKIANAIAIAVAVLLIIVAFCGRYFPAGLKAFANFFVGAFGMAFYGIMIAIIVACSFTLAGKNIRVPIKYVVHFALLYLLVVVLVHMLSTRFIADMEFGNYAENVFNYYDLVPTFGGFLFGAIAYGLESVLTVWGASIVLVLGIAWTVYVCGDFFYSYFTGKINLTSPTSKPKQPIAQPAMGGATHVATETKSDEELSRDKAMRMLFPTQPTTVQAESVKYDTDTILPPKDVTAPTHTYTPTREDALSTLFGTCDVSAPTRTEGSGFFAKPAPFEGAKVASSDEIPVRPFGSASEITKVDTTKQPTTADSSWIIPSKPAEKPVATPTPTPAKPVATPVVIPTQPTATQPSLFDDFDEDDSDDVDLPPVDVIDTVVPPSPTPTPIVRKEEPKPAPVSIPVSKPTPVPPAKPSETDVASGGSDSVGYKTVLTSKRIPNTDYEQVGIDVVPVDTTKPKKTATLPYKTPPFDLLSDVVPPSSQGEDAQRRANAIVKKLEVFGIQTELADIIIGPSVTRFMFRVLSERTRMNEFEKYSGDLKSCLQASDDIIIKAPFPGTDLVAIEVANKTKQMVRLRGLLESPEFTNAKGKLTFVLGREIAGKVIVADLAEMPHLLIAGTTGSGKSVCLNCMIVSMLYKYSPDYLRFLMVDPKYVELSRYNGIPHMLTNEAIVKVEDALAGMDYLISEMESRYQLFRSVGASNITEYNKSAVAKNKKLPYLVLVVDELADLMSTSKKAFESKIIRLAQKSRAAGIHIVLATQRPSVDIVTGVIKANLPGRIALKVSSFPDSKTILDSAGAEKLLGNGDMLFLDPGKPNPDRIQGAFVGKTEIDALVQFSKDANECIFDDDVSKQIFISQQEAPAPAEEESASDGTMVLDPYCRKALRYWIEKKNGQTSIASIQRALGIGFNRAGRIYEQCQQMHFIEELAASESSGKSLKVLVTLEDLDRLLPDQED